MEKIITTLKDNATQNKVHFLILERIARNEAKQISEVKIKKLMKDKGVSFEDAKKVLVAQKEMEADMNRDRANSEDLYIKTLIQWSNEPVEVVVK